MSSSLNIDELLSLRTLRDEVFVFPTPEAASDTVEESPSWIIQTWCENSSPTLTDIDDAKLTNSRVINSSFHQNKTGCQMTFDDDYSAYWVYFVNFLGTLAVLPGNIVSALLMDKIGRLSMLGKDAQTLLSCWMFWIMNSKGFYDVVLQGAPWCCQASAASSSGSAPVSPWWSSCSVSITGSVSLRGTLWMWSPLSCIPQTGGECSSGVFPSRSHYRLRTTVKKIIGKEL